MMVIPMVSLFKLNHLASQIRRANKVTDNYPQTSSVMMLIAAAAPDVPLPLGQADTAWCRD